MNNRRAECVLPARAHARRRRIIKKGGVVVRIESRRCASTRTHTHTHLGAKEQTFVGARVRGDRDRENVCGVLRAGPVHVPDELSDECVPCVCALDMK